MKIGIIIPLKAKKIAKDWAIVESSLRKTLDSILRQTRKSFEVIIVGHDRPDFLHDGNKTYQSISFLKFDKFPPPELTSINKDNQIKFEKDRVAKIQTGFERLVLDEEISHFFPLDADDLLHELFVQTLLDFSEKDVLIENGYILYANSGVLNKTKNFSQFCGSSAILTKKTIFLVNKKSGEFIFRLVGHVEMKKFLQDEGFPVFIPRERLLMYVRDNGENISSLENHGRLYKFKRMIKKRVRTTFFKQQALKNFGLS